MSIIYENLQTDVPLIAGCFFTFFWTFYLVMAGKVD